jgi:hypothetical protein
MPTIFQLREIKIFQITHGNIINILFTDMRGLLLLLLEIFNSYNTNTVLL